MKRAIIILLLAATAAVVYAMQEPGDLHPDATTHQIKWDGSQLVEVPYIPEGDGELLPFSTEWVVSKDSTIVIERGLFLWQAPADNTR